METAITNDILTHLPHGGERVNIPRRIIIHAMGEFITDDDGGRHHAVKFLDKRGLSAHMLGAPDGTRYRCRHDAEIAWHAKGHNTNTLGYEFLVPGEHDYASFLEAIKTPYVTDEAYKAGVEQMREWVEAHNISVIERHSDVSPGRKFDPGDGFPWLDFLADIGAS